MTRFRPGERLTAARCEDPNAQPLIKADAGLAAAGRARTDHKRPACLGFSQAGLSYPDVEPVGKGSRGAVDYVREEPRDLPVRCVSPRGTRAQQNAQAKRRSSIVKKLTIMTLVGLFGLAPLAVEPAQAVVVKKTTVYRGGPVHGCRTVTRTVWRHGRYVRVRQRTCG